MASVDYYNTPEEFGNYQYTTLKDIINDYMMSRDADDYTSTVPRFKVLYQARKAFREFYMDIMREVKAIELDLSPNLTVILPPDFVNYVRISWVDGNGELQPMASDNRMSIAKEYLQDNNYNLLFDNEGCVLIGDSQVSMDESTIEAGSDTPSQMVSSYNFCSSFQPNTDLSRSFVNGRYNINKTEGVIEFGSDAKGRTIVLEYISDGLFTGCEGLPEQELRIHKFAVSAVMDFIFYELIKNRRSIPQNEKQRARKEYYNSRKNAKMRVNSLRKDELLQVFKGSSRWIK